MNIPDIRNDAEAVAVIDELKHRLKSRIGNETPIADYLNDMLNDVIGKFGLDWDQHSFARLPKLQAAGLDPLPVQPEWPTEAVGCDRGCSPMRTGIGITCECDETGFPGSCGRYWHPGDPGYAELDAFMRQADAYEKARK